MATFPPPPTYTLPVEVDETSGKSKFSTIWLAWFIDIGRVFSTLNIGPDGSIVHNDSAGLQGGAADEFYHLDEADYNALAGTRTTKGVEASDDLVVLDSAKGLVLKDTQSPPHYWRIKVNTSGVLTSTDLGTTAP